MLELDATVRKVLEDDVKGKLFHKRSSTTETVSVRCFIYSFSSTFITVLVVKWVI